MHRHSKTKPKVKIFVWNLLGEAPIAETAIDGSTNSLFLPLRMALFDLIAGHHPFKSSITNSKYLLPAEEDGQKVS